jgi:phosphoribosylamine--glycine ligase
MKVLIIGSGGREHALAWKAAASAGVEAVYVAPGNAGTQREPGVQNVSIGAEDVTGLLDFARSYGIDLTIVGPEAPLVAGLVDAFREAGLRCFGPARDAARLEGSKAFAKAFMQRHGIPTAAYATFTDAEEARQYLRERGAPAVVKADGLAAGKGVVVAATLDEALEAVDRLLGDGSGERIVIEELLQGEEVSFMAMVSGEQVLPLATSQDHKARDDGDRGPNTGGMGAYSPADLVTPALERRILDEVIRPTVRGLAADGVTYTGFLYAGLMIAADGTPKVLEFNVRLGDPETQPLLMRLRSELVELCNAALDQRLDGVKAEWDPRAAVGVVMASGGYPGSYARGFPIHGLPQNTDSARVFHAGTAFDDAGEVINAGGRVLCACALGSSVAAAQRAAYDLAAGIHWEGAFYRTDIGYRAVARETGR